MWIIEYADKENTTLFGSALVSHKDIDLKTRDESGRTAFDYAVFHQDRSKEIKKLIKEKTCSKRKMVEEPANNNSNWAQREDEKKAKKEIEILVK